MSFNVGELVGYLKLDTSGVGKGIRTAQADIQRGLSTIDKETGKAGSKSSKAFVEQFRSGLKSLKPTELAAEFGKGLAGVFAVTKAVEWFRGAITAASDANETVNKSSVIFGRNQAAMAAWAKGATTAFGMSSAGALGAAANFGDMFQQLGFADDKAAAMSRSVVQMAADFGSFNNLGTEDVLERIAAGFRGEYDSLQKLIPNISAARVEQEALAMTGKKSAASLTAQEKAAATLAIVQKDGARAMGDFARTSDQAANAQKIAAAQTQELAVKVGNMLLPAWTALVKFGGNYLIPLLSGTADAVAAVGTGVGFLVTAFRDLPGPLQAGIVGLAAFLLLRDRMASFGQSMRTHIVDTAKAAQGQLDTLRLRAMYAGDAAAAAGGGFKGMSAAVGGVKGAASGLLGVLGGPWGAAFTGATMLLGLWAQQQADSNARVQALSDSLDKQTGAVTENSRAFLAKQMAENGAFDTARELGLSLDTVTDAALGNAEAMKVVTDTFDAYANSVSLVDPSYKNLIYTLQEYAKETEAAKVRSEQTKEALGGTSVAADDARVSIEGTGNAAKLAAKDFETMASRLERLRNQALDARSAARDYEAAVDDLAEAVKANGNTLDITTEKGRANQAALDKVAQSALAAAKANLEQGASQSAVNEQIDLARGKFIDQATKLLGSRDAAIALADQLGVSRSAVKALADEITTANGKTVRITVDQAYLKAQLDSVRAQLNSLSGVATVTARLEASRLKNELRLLQNGVVTNANGSISMNGVRMMASGDITRQAMIMRRTAPILWNEAQGGESYIPLAPSKRARSLRIWEKTGELLGVGAGGGGGGLSADALSAAVSRGVAKGLNGALDGATLRLGDVDKITNEVAAQLLIARRRAL